MTEGVASIEVKLQSSFGVGDEHERGCSSVAVDLLVLSLRSDKSTYRMNRRTRSYWEVEGKICHNIHGPGAGSDQMGARRVPGRPTSSSAAYSLRTSFRYVFYSSNQQL